MLVQYKAKNIYWHGDSFKLLPGVNEVGDALVEKALQHPLFKRRVDRGQVVLIPLQKAKDGKISVIELKKLIPNMYDRELLKKMLIEDDRREVQIMVKTQLERIKAPTAADAKKREDDNHFGSPPGD